MLTAFTVFLVVVILFWFGGEGVHGFAFCMLIGVFVGCYSSIYIAAPILYWLIGTHTRPRPPPAKRHRRCPRQRLLSRPTRSARRVCPRVQLRPSSSDKISPAVASACEPPPSLRRRTL